MRSRSKGSGSTGALARGGRMLGQIEEYFIEGLVIGDTFVFGGEAPAGTFNQAEAYDARNNGWSTHARMPTARHGLGAAVVAGNLGRADARRLSVGS